MLMKETQYHDFLYVTLDRNLQCWVSRFQRTQEKVAYKNLWKHFKRQLL